MIIATSGTHRGEQTEPQDKWFTFSPDPSLEAELSSLGALEALREGHLPPSSFPRPVKTAGEVLTYVHEGSLLYEDSNNASVVLRAGEFHRITLGSGFQYKETNASATQWARVFQVWLTPSGNCQPAHESKRFGAAERRQGLFLVASPDGRRGSLTVHQDCLIYSAILPSGRHLIHPLARGRMALLQVVNGEIQISDLVLHVGDTALVSDEQSVSFSSRGESEVILLDMGKRIQTLNGAAA